LVFGFWSLVFGVRPTTKDQRPKAKDQRPNPAQRNGSSQEIHPLELQPRDVGLRHLLLLIVAFIFLTPKEWFNRTESLATQTSRLIVKQTDFSPDKTVLQRRVRELSGNPDAEIVEWRERRTDAGETVYEIEIR
jgi:hypothetical protein